MDLTTKTANNTPNIPTKEEINVVINTGFDDGIKIFLKNIKFVQPSIKAASLTDFEYDRKY